MAGTQAQNLQDNFHIDIHIILHINYILARIDHVLDIPHVI